MDTGLSCSRLPKHFWLCRSLLTFVLAVVLFSGLIAQIALADSILINNYSFENGTGYWAEGNGVSSWTGAGYSGTGSGNASVTTGTGAGLTGYTGSDVLALHVDTGGTPANGTMWISTKSLGTYQSNTVYTLTVAEATAQSWFTAGNEVIGLAAQNNLPPSGTTPSYLVASSSVNFSNLTTSFRDISVVIDTYHNPSLVGENIGVILEDNVLLGTYGREGFFDNVRLNTSPVILPEPSAFVLLGLGGLVILLRRRVRQIFLWRCG